MSEIQPRTRERDGNRVDTRRHTLALITFLGAAVAAGPCSYFGDDERKEEEGAIESAMATFEQAQAAAQVGGPLAATQGSTPGSANAVSDVAAFSGTVYPLVRSYCSGCHAGFGPGSPSFAHTDVNVAYRAVVDNQKVSLSSPLNSRLVQRLVTDGHYCWGDCADNGDEMRREIVEWGMLVNSTSGSTPPGRTTENSIASTSLLFQDGTNGGGTTRVQDATIALYEFNAGSGVTAYDTSNVSPAMDLALSGVDWSAGGGIEIQTGKATATPQTSRKLFDQIAASNGGSQQFSIEAWVTPANINQDGPARIVTYSNDTSRRNFTMGQNGYNYVFRNRSRAGGIGNNGTPALETDDDDERLQDSQQHVVMTFDQSAGRRIFVNGDSTGDVDNNGPGLLTNWDPEYTFLLGNEKTDDRLWQGTLQLVAIHRRALSPAEVTRNYDAGVNPRVILRFGLDAWLDAGNLVEFEASEFDNFSYMFCSPTFVSPNPNGFRVMGLRLAVNGQIPVAGQPFTHVDTTIDSPRQLLSDLCAIVPKERGPALDQFSIVFEILGANQNLYVEDQPVAVVNNEVQVGVPNVGVRDFAQINDSMAALTGVDRGTSNVRTAYDDLRQQLPSTSDVMSFVSSQQVAIAKLGLEYCDTLVDSSNLRQNFFGTAFEFTQPVVVAFADQTDRDQIINPLIDQMYGINVSTQPSRAEAAPVLNDLLDDLTLGCNAQNCDAVRTRTIVKATCAAVLSSAAVHLQ